MGTNAKKINSRDDCQRGTSFKDKTLSEKSLTSLVWITWEKQRRSISLARELGARYFEMDYDIHPLKRYTKSIFRTLITIFNYRKSIVIVQNPSMILALLATITTRILMTKLVIDRHTDHYILEQGDGLIYRIFLAASRFTIKYADLTIVTNSELSEKVSLQGGQPFVLPDPLPQVSQFVDNPQAHAITKEIVKSRKIVVFIVAAWAWDEPMAAYFETARHLPEYEFYVSGRPTKQLQYLFDNKPDNLHSTGFISDETFYTLMSIAKVVIAVTKSEATLVCAGYESLVMKKPFVTGSSRVLKKFFGRAAENSDGSAESIANCIKNIMNNYLNYQDYVEEVEAEKRKQWPILLQSLCHSLITIRQ